MNVIKQGFARVTCVTCYVEAVIKFTRLCRTVFRPAPPNVCLRARICIHVPSRSPILLSLFNSYIEIGMNIALMHPRVNKARTTDEV